MELIDEGGDPRRDVGRHWDGTDHITAALEYRLPFGRVSRYLCQLEFGAAILTPQRDPDARLAVGEIDQASFADDASGSPATRFCGFRRTTLSAPIARMR